MDPSVHTEQAHQVYELTREFLKLLHQQDQVALRDGFQVSEAVYLEIIEVLDGFLPGISNWELPPKEMAFSGDLRIFDVFQMNCESRLGIESSLWLDGKEQEPVLHAEVDFSGSSMVFHYAGIW